MLAEPPRPTVPQLLDRAWRWSLWDYTDATKLAKVIIGVPPHRYTNRAEAHRALGYQHRADAAGKMYARAGIALSVNPSDGQRLAPWLAGIELFIDPGLPDLPIVLPEALGDPVATNGQPPTDQTRPETPNGKPRSRGIRLPAEVWHGLETRGAETQEHPGQIIERLVRQYLQT